MNAENRPELGLLMVAVPMHISEMRAMPEDERLARAKEDGQFVAEHGDNILYRGRHTKDGFNRLARGLAALAFQPGGVTFSGMHFCTDHEACRSAVKA